MKIFEKACFLSNLSVQIRLRKALTKKNLEQKPDSLTDAAQIFMKQFCIELMHAYGSCELELSNLQKDVKQEESESDAPDPAIRKESIVKAKEIKEELEKVLY